MEKINILVVDDEELIRNFLKKALEEKNYKVFLANNTRSAIQFIKKEKIHIILTDIYMPQEKGFAILDYIKHNNLSIPVIIMTGYPSIENTIEALRAGAINYLKKPINLRYLYSILQNTIDTLKLTIMDTSSLPFLSTKITCKVNSEAQYAKSLVYLTDKLLNNVYKSAQQDILNFDLCLYEALTNAIVHGNKNDRNKKIHFALKIQKSQIEVAIKDEGEGFDYKNTPDPKANKFCKNLKGNGIFLMRCYMDKVEYSENGTKVKLVKSISTSFP